MPDDRLFHKRLGHSMKVNLLSDAEEIVWRTYIQAADDFGVMRFASVSLQDAHDRLAKRAPGAVQRMLERVAEVGLILTFEHQLRRYCYQPDWQDYQKVRYPLRTSHPKIPDDLLEACSPATRWLHTAWPGGRKKLPTWQPPEDESGSSGNSSGNLSGNSSGNLSGKDSRKDSGRSRASAPAGGVFPFPVPLSLYPAPLPTALYPEERALPLTRQTTHTDVDDGEKRLRSQDEAASELPAAVCAGARADSCGHNDRQRGMEGANQGPIAVAQLRLSRAAGCDRPGDASGRSLAGQVPNAAASAVDAAVAAWTGEAGSGRSALAIETFDRVGTHIPVDDREEPLQLHHLRAVVSSAIVRSLR